MQKTYVLIIDKDAASARSVGNTLREAGYHVVIADPAKGRPTLEIDSILPDGRIPDLILLVASKDDDRGQKWLSALGQSATMCDVPVVLLSDVSGVKDATSSSAPVCRIATSLSQPELLQSIASLLPSAAPGSAATEENETAPDQPEAQRVSDSRDTDAGQDATEYAETAMDDASKTPLIMIVDDDMDVLSLLSCRCMGLGLEVVTATTANEAISIASERLPDVISMDVGLPGGNGLAASEFLRSDPRFETVPIIAITGRQSREVLPRCHQLGVYYLPKSADMWEQMYALLCDLLDMPQPVAIA